MQKTSLPLENEVKSFLSNINLDLGSMEFIPIGEDSYSWKVKINSQNLFVKYCSEKKIISHLPIVHKLLVCLKDFDFVVPPVQLDRKTELPFRDGYLYAYPFIDGDVVTMSNNEFDKKLVRNLIEIMAKIHTFVVNRSEVPLFEEAFEYSFDQRYSNILDLLKQRRMVPEISRMHLDKISKLILDFNKLIKKYKTDKPQVVLTHGDITGLNIMITKGGRIKLLDWDGAMFAPKERDFNYLYDNKYFDIDYYYNLSGLSGFDSDLRKLYNYLWRLESILLNMERLQDYKEDYGSREYLLNDIFEYL